MAPSFMSPPPMPPPLARMITRKRPPPTRMPRTVSSQAAGWRAIASTAPTTMPGSVMTSGMIWWSRSMPVIATRAANRRSAAPRSSDGPTRRAASTNSTAVSELDRRVPPRDASPAVAAARAKPEPGEHGHVVVPADGAAAGRAGRGRMHDAPAVGKARDDDVEKAADDEAKEEARRLEEQGRDHDVIVQERGPADRQDRGNACATREGPGP